MDDDLRVSKNWQATPQGNGTTAVKWNEIWEIPTNPKCYPIISDTIHFTMCTFRPSLITLTWRRRCSQSHWAPVKHMAKEFKCKTTSSSKISSLIFCFFFIAPKFQRQCQALICGWWRWWSSVDDLQQAPSTNWELRSVVSWAPKLLW